MTSIITLLISIGMFYLANISGSYVLLGTAVLFLIAGSFFALLDLDAYYRAKEAKFRSKSVRKS